MKKMAKKEVYVTPSTRVNLVEMEGSVCAGSVETGTENGVNNHEGNNDFGGGGFDNDEWD